MKSHVLHKLNAVKKHYVFTIGVVAFINILLAVLALAKDIFIASYMGTTTKSDAFMLAFFITDMIGNNLIGSALGASCIPILTKLYMQKNQHSFYRYINKIKLYAIFLSSSVISILFLFRDTIIYSLGNGFALETRKLCINLLLVLLPTILIYPLVSIGISVLQVRKQFIIGSLIPVLFNLIFLLGVLYCYLYKVPIDQGIYVTAGFILLAVLLIGGLSLFLNKQRRVPQYSLAVKSVEAQDIFKLFVPYLLVLMLGQLILYVERYLASGLAIGSVAALNYAYRLAQFPIWIFVSAISTVIFPMMSKYKNKEDISGLKGVFERAISNMLIITIPMMIVLYILRDPIIATLFLRGSFNNHSLYMTSEILEGYVFVILGQSIFTICLRFFLAIEKMIGVLFVFLAAFILNVILDIYLIPIVNLAAFGYGAAISALLISGILLFMMKIDVKAYLRKGYNTVIKLTAMNSIVALICIIMNLIWNHSLRESGFLLRTFYLGSGMILIASFYFVSLRHLQKNN